MSDFFFKINVPIVERVINYQRMCNICMIYIDKTLLFFFPSLPEI